MKAHRTHSGLRLSLFALVLALICSAAAFAQDSISTNSKLPAGLPASQNGAPQQSGAGWDVLSYSLNGSNPSYEVNGIYVPAFGTIYRGNGDSYNLNNPGYETWTATPTLVPPPAFSALSNNVFGAYLTPSTSGAVQSNVGNFWCSGGTAQGIYADAGAGAPLASNEVFCWAGDWTTIEAMTNNNWLKAADQPVANQMGIQCQGCHGHSTIDGYDGPAYMVSGHKNGMRKVVPGMPLSGSDGQPYTTGLDYATKDTVTINWTTGQATDTTTGVTKTALYLIGGWVNSQPYVVTDQSSTNYGCFRCHATGYNFVAQNTSTGGPNYVGSAGDWTAQGLAAGYPTFSGPEPTSVGGPGSPSLLQPIPVEGGAANAFSFTTIGSGSGVGEINRVPDTMVGMTTPPSSSWYLTGVRCERCHDGSYATPNSVSNVIPSTSAPVYEKDGPSGGSSSVNGTWPTAPANMQATALCMSCHRQEAINPGSGVTAGAVAIPTSPVVQDNGNCSDGISSTYLACNSGGGTWKYIPTAGPWAFQGQEFLASPHAMFNPQGKIQLAHQNSSDLTLLEGTGTLTDPTQYSSFNATQGSYQSAGVTGLSGMANNGCVGCHDAHETTVNTAQSETNQTVGVLPGSVSRLPNGVIVNSVTSHNCSSCHATIASNLMRSVAHPKGPGTPFPYGEQTNPDSACFTCHMNGQSGVAGSHLFQINADRNYYTYPPTAAAFSAEAAPINGSATSFAPMNTYNNGRWTNAVGLDVDIACGQCHGGGANGTNPYGLTVPKPGPPAFTRTFLAQAAKGMHYLADVTSTPAPLFSVAGGTYATTQTVTISDEPDTTIYYTLTAGTTGVVPTAASTTYTGPVPVSATSVLEAIAVGPTGYTVSSATSATYTIAAASAVATPTFNLGTGTYTTNPTNVMLSDATSGATICYEPYVPPATAPTAPTTTGDTTCKAGFTGPVASGSTVSVTTTEGLVAYAIATGLKDSSAASATYTLGVQVPTMSVAAGQYNTAQSLYLLDLTPGAVICYATATGAATPATPTISSGSCTTGIQYTGAAINIPTGIETNVIAIAGLTGQPNSLPTSVAKYNATVATPSFDFLGAAPSGSSYNGTQQIQLLDLTSGAVICYSTTGTASISAGVCGSGSTQYTGPISVSTSETISAIAGVASGLANSSTASATFSINTVTAPPTASIASGTYGGPQVLQLSDSIVGAAICYTTDGSAPSLTGAGCGGTSTQYTTGITIPVSATTVVEALAGGVAGMTNSTVAGPWIYNPPVTPTITPVAQIYYAPQTVMISDLTTNASIFYTTTGVAPNCSSTAYNPLTGIPVSATETIQAVACVGTVASPVTSPKTFTIAIVPPVFTAPAGARYYSLALQSSDPTDGAVISSGTYVASAISPLKVAMSDAAGSTIICYTTNGTTPTVVAGPVCGNGTLYSTLTPLSIRASAQIRAVAGTGLVSSPTSLLSLSITPAVQ